MSTYVENPECLVLVGRTTSDLNQPSIEIPYDAPKAWTANQFSTVWNAWRDAARNPVIEVAIWCLSGLFTGVGFCDVAKGIFGPELWANQFVLYVCGVIGFFFGLLVAAHGADRAIRRYKLGRQILKRLSTWGTHHGFEVRNGELWVIPKP